MTHLTFITTVTISKIRILYSLCKQVSRETDNKHFKGSFELLRLTCIKKFDVPIMSKGSLQKKCAIFTLGGRGLDRKIFPQKICQNFTFFGRLL